MPAVFEYRYARRKVAETLGTVHSPADVAAVLCEFVNPDAAESEVLAVALLDVKNAIIGVETVYRGNLAGTTVRVCEVFRTAVRLNAAALIVAHNHPSGDPTPSPDDIALTAELVRAGRLLNIELLDHVILASRSHWISLRALGAFEEAA